MLNILKIEIFNKTRTKVVHKNVSQVCDKIMSAIIVQEIILDQICHLKIFLRTLYSIVSFYRFYKKCSSN